MSYVMMHALHEAPAPTCVTAPLVGAAFGAVIGALCFAVVSTTNLYASSVVRPAVPNMATTTMTSRAIEASQLTDAELPAAPGGHATEEFTFHAETVSFNGWVATTLAALASSVSGLLLWRSRRASLAATTGRREALLSGVAAAGFAGAPAFAAYGDAANVFGAPKDVDQFLDISGDGWAGKIPGKYNISKEREVEGIVGRWEDNFDAVNNSLVIVKPIGKNSVTELGSLDDVRNNFVTPLLGQQAIELQSISEGGFAPGRFANAAILDQKEVSKGGKTYYTYELLTRTADGNEGGRHQLFSVAASNGKLIIFKTQAGDKRWFKGLERPLRKAFDAFTVY